MINAGSTSKTGGKLKRQLGFWDSVAINVGIVIGVGIFRVPAEIAQHLDQPLWILAAWVMGGLVSLVGVMCYAELSSCYPHTGGTYVYLKEAYGNRVAFLYGWIEFTILRAGSLAGIAYIFTAYLKNLAAYPAEYDRWVAIAAILLFTLLNTAGLKVGTRIQYGLSFLKIFMLSAMTFLIVTSISGPAFKPNLLPASGNMHNLIWFAPALIPVLWSYGGWHESTFMSGEFKDTRRALPWSLVASALIVMTVYLLINVAYLKAMTSAEMKGSEAIAADIFTRLFGSGGKWLMTIAILISASGALNSTVLTGGRIPFAVGCDYRKIGWLGEIHGKSETPLRAYWVNAAWAAVLVIWGDFEQLVFFCGFAKWLVFTLAGLSVFILRKKLVDSTRFMMTGYPVVPVLFTAVSVALCLTTVFFYPKEAFFGACLIAAGLPVYAFLQKHR